MKHFEKILVILMALCLCGAFAACSSTAENTGDNSAEAESAAEDIKEEEKPEAKSETEAEPEPKAEPETETDDAIRTANIGVIAWSTGLEDESFFVEAVKATLSEQYPDQIGEIFVADAHMDAMMLSAILENYIAMWESEKTVILIVNDKDGFSDEELLSVLKDAEKAGIITGVDHIIDGAPESTFVYDASDVAGCASKIMENAFK